MKIIRNIQSIAVVVFSLVMLTASNGCVDDSPLSSDNSNLGNELQFVKIGEGSTSLKKVVQVTDYVTYENGGKLQLVHKVKNTKGQPVQVVVSLNVLPHSISEDAELSLTLDDEVLIGNVDVTFQPHGITFSKPAILNIEAKNLDLAETDPETIDIWYDNPETGQWEKMERKKVVVKTETGILHIVGAEIPHFSRYAAAWGGG